MITPAAMAPAQIPAPTGAGIAIATVLEALRGFPLVPRPRPIRAPLAQRLAEIRALVDAAPTSTDPLTAHAVAWNKAALLASDHHLPALARHLCWRHHHRYRTLPTWSGATARLALEPLVNLARLHLRDCHPDNAITVLTALCEGIDTSTDTTIDDHAVSTSRITRDPGQHRRLRTWMWSVLLAEGIRGLAAANRWTDALAHAHRHHGIGDRLLDGRQTAIITHLTTGDPTTARRILTHSDIREPWERAIATTLAGSIDLATSSLDPAGINMLVEDYLAVDLDDRHAAFTERLGLAVAALARHSGWPELAELVHHRLADLATLADDQPKPNDAATLANQLLDTLRLS